MPFVRQGEKLEGFSRDAVRVAIRGRGTLLISSRAALRERGLFDRYEAELTPGDRATLAALTPAWVPMAQFRTHYAAIDRLALPPEVQLDLGRGLFSRMHRPVFDIGVRLAGSLGATPWTVAEQAVRLWPRLIDGGDVLITQLGPKDLRFEILGFPIAGIPYCRFAWRGIVLGATEIFAFKAYIRDVPTMCTHDRLAYRVSWV